MPRTSQDVLEVQAHQAMWDRLVFGACWVAKDADRDKTPGDTDYVLYDQWEKSDALPSRTSSAQRVF